MYFNLAAKLEFLHHRHYPFPLDTSIIDIKTDLFIKQLIGESSNKLDKIADSLTL